MKFTYSCLMILALQLFLTFKGVNYFGKWVNPILLFVAFILLFGIFIGSFSFSTNIFFKKNSLGLRIIICTIGVLTIIACFSSLRNLFHQFPNPVDMSDVLPQLEIQYDRFCHGQMPYQKIKLPHSYPFPVYMPLHWLPIGVPKILGIDIRWAGFFLLIPVLGLYSWVVAHRKLPFILTLIAVLLPVFVFISFIFFGDGDIAVTLETIIAAYYLIVAVGLLQKNLFIITLGICLCLLSRYTLIFWLPLFIYLLYLNKGIKKTATMLIIIVATLCLLYIIPFLSKDPSIFLTGLKYHNGAAEFEWEYGAFTFESGIYFAPHINALFKGDFAHKVICARVCQGAGMLLLFVGGLWYYRKLRNKISFYDFSLGMLYMFMVFFYMISPLTYHYYMITPLFLSTALCARILENSASFENTVLVNLKR